MFKDKSLAAVQHFKGDHRFISARASLREKEEKETFAVGHFALGYLLGKSASQVTRTKMNIPLVLTLSVIPDIDILIPYVEHRGPFHSIIMAAIIFIPIFALYRKSALPYFIALIQHPLIGDYIADGQVQLLWPITSQTFGIEISIRSLTNITLEWLTFIAAAVVMVKTKDTHALLQPKSSNLILAIPTFTVLLPTFLAFPLSVPTALIPPHIICLTLFLTSILIDIKKIVKQKSSSVKNQPTNNKLKRQ
ncbi:MAG: metal-dependent hydrolase [Candidatus Bathyarchaeia archaeon]